MEGISLGSAFLRLYGDRTALDRELKLLGRYTEALERKGIKVKVDADTGKARQEVDALKGSLNSANEAFKLLGQGLRGDKSAWTGLGDLFQGIAGKAAASGGAIGKMGGALGGATALAGKAIPILGQLGLAAQGLKFIFDGLSTAINGALAPLKALSYEAGKFNAKVAQAGIFTSSAFAVMGPDGQSVEGTANQMRALRGTIAKEFREIKREASEIAGATASDIFEGFNVILQYSAALGEAGEDLENVRKLSTRTAAAMNTLGVPAYQLRSELSSLLTGNINRANDKLATDLGYDSATIRRLQEEGKLYDDLMERLGKLYDGQKVLADSLSNVSSNFESVFQTISAQGGIALERGMGKALAAVLDPLARLENAFIAFVRGTNEMLEPLLKMLGEIAGWFVSAGAMIASTLGAVMDVVAVLTSALGAALMPGLRAIGKTLQLVAKLFELVGASISSVLRPITTFFRVIGDSDTDDVDGFFDVLLDGLDRLIAYANKAAVVIAKPFIELAKAREWLRGKALGRSDEEISQRQQEVQAGFDAAVGASSTPRLKSLQLSTPTTTLLQAISDRYGATEDDQQLQQQREMSQLVTDRLNNEVKGLEQSLRLMQVQKSVQEAMNQLAEARRGLTMSRAGFSVQLAASPEARLAAEERRNDLAQQQEQERINERRALLGTERQMLQTQLQIQLRQQKIQQEQLKIQKGEIQIQRIKAEQAAREIAGKLVGLNPNSTEFRVLREKWSMYGRELELRDRQLDVLRRTQSLALEQEGVIRQTNSLEGQRLDIQGQQLGVADQMAGLTREQQATMANLQRQQQEITNQLETQLNAKKDQQAAISDELRQLERQVEQSGRLEQLDRSRLELRKAQADAAVQVAEQELRVAQAQSRANTPGASTKDVITAQIEALVAGRRGLVSEADATRRLYDAKQQQLNAEQQLQREAQRLQMERERSEQKIAELRLQASLVESKSAALRLQAEQSRQQLQQQQDSMSGLGPAPAAPVLPPPPGGRGAITGGIGNMLPGTRGGPNINRGVSANHAGRDLGLDVGDPIHARRAGVVEQYIPSYTRPGARYMGEGMRVRYDDGMQGTYGHIQDPAVNVGQRVEAGQYLAKVFNDAMNTHLHYEMRNQGGQIIEPLPYIQESLRVPAGATSLPVTPAGTTAGTAASATSLQNAMQGTEAQLRETQSIEQGIREQLEFLRSVIQPNLEQLQANQRETLNVAQRAQQDAMEMERIRAKVTAQVLSSPGSRLAADLADGITAGLTTPIRAVFSQMFRGEFNFSQMAEEISLQMAERITGAFIDAALAPIEEQLKGSLFKAFSGVDLEQEVIKAQQEAAQNLKDAGDQLKSAAADLSAAGTGGSTGFSGTSPAAALMGDIRQVGAATWKQGFAGLEGLDTSQIEKKAKEASDRVEKLGEDAEDASEGTKEFMKGAGKAMTALGGLAMAVGGVEMMGKGGTYNTLMGLASVFGGIASVAGAFVPRARGGPVTANTSYLVGEEGPELFIPSQDGEISSTARTQALLAARGALGGPGASGGLPGFTDSQDALQSQQMLSRERSTERILEEVINNPGGKLDVHYEAEVINETRYVTAEQFERGMSDAAQRGYGMTMNALRNNVKARNRVGLR